MYNYVVRTRSGGTIALHGPPHSLELKALCRKSGRMLSMQLKELFNVVITAVLCAVHEVGGARSATHRIPGMKCLLSTQFSVTDARNEVRRRTES